VPVDDFQLFTVVSLPFEENSYIAHRTGRDDCVIFDPGLEPEQIQEYLEERGLKPAAILLTHGHGDHIAGNAFLKSRWPDCPLMIGHGDAPKLTDPELNLSAGFGIPVVSPPADRLLAEGERIEVAGFEFDIYEIPGHSSGHVVFVWSGHEPAIVFGGDILFAGSIGRTDFPGGSFEQLADGIHKHLFTLPDDTLVYSGHGPVTTIGRQKRENPYVGRPSGWEG
jgi:glyoxylase-like metal-dependent hydrolase (beta-lactamase superfamily II)